jgi:hypothetical protein
MSSIISALPNGVPVVATDILPFARGAGDVRGTANDMAKFTIAKLMFNVKDNGALGDGSTDDTAAIRATIALAVTAGGGIVFFPPGTYIVATTVTGGTILNITGTNVHLQGAGRSSTKIKVKDHGTTFKYNYVISGVTGSEFTTDVSGLEVEGLTIDFNITNNPVTLLGFTSDANNYQDGIGAFTGTDISIHDCSFINGSSVNVITCNGPAVSRVNISRNIFTNNGDDPSHIVHDVSVIYTHATNVSITQNMIESVAVNCPGGVTGIETHGSNTLTQGNIVINYQAGIFLTGIAITDTTGLACIGNSISGAQVGILLWSTPYSTHTSGYGIDGCIVSGNTISLAGKSNVLTAGKYTNTSAEFGIAVNVNAPGELDVTNLTISDNNITHPLEGASVTNSTASLGIGWWSINNQTMHNSRIVNNRVVNFPLAGIRLSCEIDNVMVSGNTLINCGSTLDVLIGVSYRCPMFIASPVISNLTINDNKLSDTNATSRTVYFIYLYQPAGQTATQVYLIDNVFVATGGTQTSILNQVFMDQTTPGVILPYMRGAIKGFLPTSGTFQKYALGSQIIDPSTGAVWTVNSNQYTWSATMVVGAGLNLGTATGAAAGGILGTNSVNGTTIWTISNPNAGASADARLQVSSDGVTALFRAVSTAGGGSAIIDITAGYLVIRNTTNQPMLFYTNNAERFRISASGAFLVGKTAATGTDASGNLEVNGKFGCNGVASQAAVASGGALAGYVTGAFGLDSNAHMQSLFNLVVAIRAALVADGIMS